MTSCERIVCPSPTITPIGRERLAKLAEHLEKGKLGHDEFDFGVFNFPFMPKCGTAGCAVGECPIVFADDWTFNEYGEPALRVVPSDDPLIDSATFFGVGSDASKNLFMPGPFTRYTRAGLDESATRYQVAANIRAFLALAQTVSESEAAR